MTIVCGGLDTPLGPMLAASDGDTLTGLWFEGQRHFPATAASWTRRTGLPLFEALRAALEGYFAGTMRDDAEWRVPLAPRGTAFQRRVWAALGEIPRGATLTYTEVAERVGAPRALRAVGAAIGRNPISILVPCHRVVGAGGTLTGYAGGLERKRALLALEGVDAENGREIVGTRSRSRARVRDAAVATAR
jgi:methylated-DNA-[protein]-cysteine S-methyltransferase